ncbi:MAG: YraN family protein [Patescibacteria group bacterium]
MTLRSLAVGKTGEKLALSFLKKRHINILCTNYRTRYGEIDIVAKADNKYMFIEVKTRMGVMMGKPYEAINHAKQYRMKRAAEWYVLKNNLKAYKLSLQVVSIVLDQKMKPISLDYFENILL